MDVPSRMWRIEARYDESISDLHRARECVEEHWRWGMVRESATAEEDLKEIARSIFFNDQRSV